MKNLLTAMIGSLLLFTACSKSDKEEDDVPGGELPMTNPPASFRGLAATVNGTKVTVSNIKIIRRAADPSLGTWPSILITGTIDKKRLEVQINFPSQPQTGIYPLTFQVDIGKYIGRVYYDHNTDSPASAGTYFGSPSVDTNKQKGKINVTVVDDHHFVGAFSAIVRSSYSGEEREVVNGQFGAEY